MRALAKSRVVRMDLQTKHLLFSGACTLVGLLSVLGGVFDWNWWMKCIGWLVTRQYGRGLARVHFMLFGLMAIGLGAYLTYDALTAPRFWPLPMPRR